MRHTFNFKGGEFLTTMGAAWFVSYCYYDKINKSHINWSQVSTVSNRRSVYSNTINFHKFWLAKVLEMKDYNLNKNTIGLSGNTIKIMAKEILSTII